MFDNLKAFIRHGKQANDMKDHHTANPVISTHAGADSIPKNLPNFDYDEHLEVIAPPANQPEPQAADHNASTFRHHSDYKQAATHIVEQEKVQRNRSPKYPNLHNYEVMEQLGEGAFSIVYKARNLATNEYVAIKILRKFQMDKAQMQAVLKEVTIMRQLNHPNIVSFIEFIESEEYYYIVQELISGGEVFSAIVNYTYLSEDLSRHIIVQVAEGIRYLHEEVGIVHRDIKPENLLYMPIEFKPSQNSAAKLRKSDDPQTKKDEGEFTPGVGGGTVGLVKLADFGLSKQIWEHNTKTPCGTVGYTAPEIVKDERYSREVDMWAIGCVLYTLLCGFPPFYDERIETLTEKVARGEYTFLSPWWDEISREAKHCVAKLLTVDPKSRYTIDDFLNDPWISKSANVYDRAQPPVARIPPKKTSHPIQHFNNKYSKKYANELYSPAAVALRDAFDISTAVHRMGEEAKLTNPNQIHQLVEEEEEDQEVVDNAGKVRKHVPKQRAHHNNLNLNTNKDPLFELNLGGASILERRKHKPLMIPS